jgi:hypothetical protein
MKNTDYSQFLTMAPAELRKRQWTKGWALSFVGLFVYAVLVLTGHKPIDYKGICPCFEVGKSWGGFEMGWFFVCGKNNGEGTKQHEVGHMIQNAAVGGFEMLAYSIGSAARWWYRKVKKITTPYDSWFFEGDASRLGIEYVRNIEEQKEK